MTSSQVVAGRRCAFRLAQLLQGSQSSAKSSSLKHTAGLHSGYLVCHWGESSKYQIQKYPAEVKHKAGIWMLQKTIYDDLGHKVGGGALGRSFSAAASQVASQGTEKDAASEETTRASEEVVGGASDRSDSTPKKEEVQESETNSQEKAEEDNEALLSLLAERNALLEEKGKQLAELKDREFSSMSELQNVRVRLQRESDGVKKYAIQDFAKSLLDVADNLGRAFTTVPENVRKEIINDPSETAKLLKGLLEGVTLTEKELMKVLKKSGVEKFEPVGQPFDPNAHLALFEVADPSKEAGMIAMVVKAGYMLHDRVLRPAEVGVVKSVE